LKKVILKGTVPVDHLFSMLDTYKVYTDKDNKMYAATLNQSNISNNNNKFYILQILINEKNPNDIIFYTRWGRVGVPGQKAEEKLSIEAAIKEYNKKLR
jgi:poly [ADP-ribose] polymerase